MKPSGRTWFTDRAGGRYSTTIGNDCLFSKAILQGDNESGTGATARETPPTLKSGQFGPGRNLQMRAAPGLVAAMIYLARKPSNRSKR
jgi:hypothetical protein